MEKIVSIDNQGRIYLPEEVRKYLRNKTLMMKLLDNKITLVPIKEDPIEALSELGKGKLKKSITELKKGARKEIEENAFKKNS